MSSEMIVAIAGLIVGPLGALVVWYASGRASEARQAEIAKQNKEDIDDLCDRQGVLEQRTHQMEISAAVDRKTNENLAAAIASMRADMDKRFDKLEGMIEKREVTGSHRVKP